PRVRDRFTSYVDATFCPALVINVLPVNEYDPILTPTSQTITIPEGAPQDLYVAEFACSDQDKESVGDPDGCSIISIESGDDAKPNFKLTSNTVNGTVFNGTISTTNNVIDYDTGDVRYTLFVIGVDSSTRDARRTGTMTVTVNIQPVNEYTPTIHNQPLGTIIPEDTLVGREIFKVNATDRDAGPHGKLTYKIIGGNDMNRTFLINPSTGQIYLHKPVDFESTEPKTHSLRIKVSDGGGLSSIATADVTVTDVNDNKPVCTPKEANITLRKDQVLGTAVLSITCTDADAGTKFKYQIASGDGGKFDISDAGDLIVKQDPYQDVDSPVYNVMIQISDGFHLVFVTVSLRLERSGVDNKNSSCTTKNWRNGFNGTVGTRTKAVCVRPSLGSATVSTEETIYVGSTIYTISGFDADGDRVIYYMRGDDPYFSLNGRNLVVKAHLDFEQATQHIVNNVWVRDGSTSASDGENCPEITVNVLPVNEHDPQFCVATQTVYIKERLPQDSFVARFDCTDFDKDHQGYPTGCSDVFIECGDDQIPKFQIVGNEILTTSNAIDYSTCGTSYTLIVVGVDNPSRGSPRSGTMTVSVNIEPAN
ncbi:protein dachsous-like, partial [Saccostrea cucullata]|uniref:protein dachsous-like n=1 Tax=Saccostrea cuccullata TaxID=36930 RepID=UPI002ED23433